MRRGTIAAGLVGALLSAAPGALSAAHASTHQRPARPAPQFEPARPVSPPAPLPEPPRPVPMPQMVPPTPPPVPMPHVLPISPRLDELRPRIALRPPVALGPR